MKYFLPLVLLLVGCLADPSTHIVREKTFQTEVDVVVSTGKYSSVPVSSRHYYLHSEDELVCEVSRKDWQRAVAGDSFTCRWDQP